MLADEVTTIIQETAIGIEERYEIEIEPIGTDKTHIPLLCGVHPKTFPGTIGKIFKNITAREIFRLKPQIRREF